MMVKRSVFDGAVLAAAARRYNVARLAPAQVRRGLPHRVAPITSNQHLDQVVGSVRHAPAPRSRAMEAIVITAHASERCATRLRPGVGSLSASVAVDPCATRRGSRSIGQHPNVALEQSRALLMAAAPPPHCWVPLQLNLGVIRHTSAGSWDSCFPWAPATDSSTWYIQPSTSPA